ncbi:hypothetical protein LTR36_005890 [Oleoguttula mirabilis]|uniref:NAD(P)-binding protein n=1 Tax=Oleoguttula mirabilis TaxID=1507867 RepID=A0AAV9JCX8_9PEZI|nr:hypothetical protein LTR36_005890 [Oleoguttula mirabilis]
MLGWTATFMKSQLFTSVPYPTSDFSGQTVIITGSNTGLGLEASKHIVRLGAAKVILAVRTVSKGEKAAQEIVQTCNVPESTVEVWQLDMSKHDSIVAFAKRSSHLPRLDAAILNAGILTYKFETHSGVESHIAVNVVGTLLLSTLLLPKMRLSAKATRLRGRLTIVGSDMMYIADLKELETQGKILDKLNDPAQSDIGQRYGVSKVLVFYSLRELAARSPLTSDSDVILSVLTPGLCRSDIFRDDVSAAGKLAMTVGLAAFARTTEVGSRTLVHGISTQLPAEAHGKFLRDCRLAEYA